MSKSRKLKPLLKNAVAWVMASTGATAGCSDVGPGIEGDPEFVSTECGALERDLIAGLRTEPEQDYLALLRAFRERVAEPVASSGEPCSTAQDEAACLTALEQAPDENGFRFGPCLDVCTEYYLTATRGDTVSILTSKEQLTGLLGTIDTPQEAMLLATLDGLDVRCGDGGARPDGTGFTVQGFTYQGCDGVTRHQLDVAADGALSERERVVLKEPNSHCAVGRRPAGLAPRPRLREARPLARYLVDSARLEAASVLAFRQIERELAVHGAPRRLLTAARRAAADEVRHARMTGGLARRFGAKRLEPPQVAPTAPRALESLLIDNATEGCVRETFGAAVGVWQAKNAGDPKVAKAMRKIAADELRHATLAWEIAAWFEPQLDEAARRRIREARRAAIAALRVELQQPMDARLVRELGVPSAESALRLHRELERRVWS